MKRIGKHRNIVSMIGCWTLSEPMQLILEYVPHGNLLNWLIKRRRTKVSDSWLSEHCLSLLLHGLFAMMNQKLNATDQCQSMTVVTNEQMNKRARDDRPQFRLS